MHGVALTVMLMAGGFGDCVVRGDCAGDCQPQCKTVCESWREFWCNLAPPADPRMTRQYWPLEYPGARERGQRAHGLAPTREEARAAMGMYDDYAQSGSNCSTCRKPAGSSGCGCGGGKHGHSSTVVKEKTAGFKFFFQRSTTTK